MSPTATRDQIDRAIAHIIHAVREEWDVAGIVSALRKCQERPVPDTIAACLYAAVNRTDQRTHAFLPLDGEHWRAITRLDPKAALTTPAAPYFQPYQAPDLRGTRTTTPEEMAAIREGIRAAATIKPGGSNG